MVGADIRRECGSPVSHDRAPFEFTGTLVKVTVVMHGDRKLDGADVACAEDGVAVSYLILS